MLSKRKGKGVVKIHEGVPTALCADHNFLRCYVIFLRLKSMYVGACLLNYRKRYDELASKLNISNSNLRKSIAFLKLKKFVFSKNDHLWLISSDKVSESLQVKIKGRYRIIADDNSESKIQTLAINENLNKQNEAIKSQYIKVELEKVYGNVQNIQHKAIKKLHRALSSIPMNEIKKRIYQQPSNYKGITAQATLSRQGIARILGYENKSTGSRIVKRLVALGYLEDVKVLHKIVMRGISEWNFKRLHFEGTYYWRSGKVFQAMPHSIYVIL